MKKLILLSMIILSLNAFSQDNEWKHVGLVGIDPLSTGTFSSTEDTLEIGFNPGISLGYEYRLMPENDWGKSFGITYHHDRSPNKMKYTNDGLNINTTIDIESEEAVSVMRVHANLISRWENFYIPFGLNYAAINYSSPVDTSYTSEGGLGFNLFFGWAFNDQFSVEYGAYSSKWDFGFELLGSQINLEGTLSMSSLILKYNF